MRNKKVRGTHFIFFRKRNGQQLRIIVKIWRINILRNYAKLSQVNAKVTNIKKHSNILRRKYHYFVVKLKVLHN